MIKNDQVRQLTVSRTALREIFEASTFERISQNSYNPTPFKDTTWEVVGERLKERNFIPFEAEVVAHVEVPTDKMFADFGGLERETADRRWHLPKDQAEILHRAMEQPLHAVAMVSLPEEEYKAQLAAARAEGLHEGLTTAQTEGEAALREMSERMQELYQILSEHLSEKITALEQHAVQLSLAIAERLVGSAAKVDPNYIVPLIREGIGLAQGSSIFKIRLSPSDFEFLGKSGLADKLKSSDGLWSFAADTDIQSGCVVDTAAGAIDLQIDAAFSRMREEILKVLA